MLSCEALGSTVLHVWTGPLVARGELRSLMAVRRRSCVRPLNAARWTAGPRWVSANKPQTRTRHRDALCTKRGSSFVGSTDPHLLQLSLHPGTCERVRQSQAAPAAGVATLLAAPIRFPGRHHGPHDAGHLVGQSHRREFARLALQQGQQPRPRRSCSPAWRSGSQLLPPAPATAAAVRCRHRLIPPRRWRPPVECSFGTRPSQAAKCRPEVEPARDRS